MDNSPSGTSSNQILDIAISISRHKGLVAFTFTITIIAGLILCFAIKPTYRATASIMILGTKNSQNIMLAQASQMLGLNLGGSNAQLSYSEILKSKKLALTINDRLNLIDSLAKYGKTLDRADYLEYMEKNIQIDDTSPAILKITATAPSRKLAADIANSYTDELKHFVIDHSLNDATRNRKFIHTMLADSRSKLRNLEEERKSLLERNRIIADPSSDTQAKLSVYSEFAKSSATARAQLDALKQRRSQSSASTGQTMLADPGITSLRGELLKKKIALLEAQQIYKPDSSSIRTLNSEIAGIESQLSSETTFVEDVQYLDLSTTVDAYTSLMGKFEKDFARIPGLSTDYLRILRDIEIQSNIVAMLTAEHEKARITEAQENKFFEVLDAAMQPKKKHAPKRMIIMLCSAVIGLSLGVFLAVFTDYFKPVPNS